MMEVRGFFGVIRKIFLYMGREADPPAPARRGENTIVLGPYPSGTTVDMYFT